MFGLLVAIIYLAFVSLGLPDSLLGSAWVVMSADLGANISAGGVITMIVSCCTIVSSLFSNFLTNKLGTALVTATSVLLTALALFGYSTCTAFWQVCLWAMPYGFGAGAVDAALNNYAALHFSSRQMNWLHCFWGVGASISPYIMGFCLTKDMGWQSGYQIVSLVQVVLTVVLFASIPLWKRQQAKAQKQLPPVKTKDALKIGGVWLVFVMFFAYCAMESSALLWSSSYLVVHKGVEKELAATFATLFCTGMTAGRFVCGFFKLTDKALIRLGTGIVFVGIVAIALPLPNWVALAGFVMIGLGCAPIYPAVIHSTPINFGEENSQAIVGVQMAFAYMGTTFMPPVLGTVLEKGSWIMPTFLATLAVVMTVLAEIVNAQTSKKNKTTEGSL